LREEHPRRRRAPHCRLHPDALQDEARLSRHASGSARFCSRMAGTRRAPRRPMQHSLPHQRELQDFEDHDLYFLAPGGDFEQGADGWQFEGGAGIGAGSNAFSPLGSGHSSLQLPAGSTATSPAFCVDERYPHFRISVGQLGEKKVQVRVSVVYPDSRRTSAGRRTSAPTRSTRGSCRSDSPSSHGKASSREAGGWLPFASRSSRSKTSPTRVSTTSWSIRACAIDGLPTAGATGSMRGASIP
jgi:hypothetical protein